MDVDSFIAKYEGEWHALESACAKGAGGLAQGSGERVSEVVRLYLRASGHLTEVRARYRNPQLEQYLNDLVARAHSTIYSGRPRSVHGAARLFGARYRQAIHETTRFIVVAGVIMFGAAVASWIWVANSAEARAGSLPPGARDAVMRSGGGRAPGLGPPPGLSTFIFINNVRVALFAFALGITIVGTVYLLVSNGLVLGVLGGAYMAFGKTAAFLSLVVPHGLLELTAICIAGGAGLRVGWSIIEPGDRPRSQALREEAGSAVIVVIGVIPAFLVAALIEGFITGTSVPNVVEIGIGILAVAGYLAFLFGVPVRATDAPRS